MPFSCLLNPLVPAALSNPPDIGSSGWAPGEGSALPQFPGTLQPCNTTSPPMVAVLNLKPHSVHSSLSLLSVDLILQVCEKRTQKETGEARSGTKPAAPAGIRVLSGSGLANAIKVIFSLSLSERVLPDPSHPLPLTPGPIGAGTQGTHLCCDSGLL